MRKIAKTKRAKRNAKLWRIRIMVKGVRKKASRRTAQRLVGCVMMVIFSQSVIIEHFNEFWREYLWLVNQAYFFIWLLSSLSTVNPILQVLILIRPGFIHTEQNKGVWYPLHWLLNCFQKDHVSRQVSQNFWRSSLKPF